MNPFQQAFNFLTGNQHYESPVPAGQQLTPKQIYDAHYADQVKAKGGYIDAQGITHYDTTGQNPVQGAMTKVIQTVLPPPQVANAQQANTAIKPNITIPYSQGGQYTLPANLSQILLNAFNKNNEATNAATVLNHPAGNSFIPSDPQSNNHINYGENGSFKTVKDTTNTDGSIDRGLFRINSNTFNGYMQNPQSKAALAQMGITNYEDMQDPQKNANFAALLQHNAGWGRWFAAPQMLRLKD